MTRIRYFLLMGCFIGGTNCIPEANCALTATCEPPPSDIESGADASTDISMDGAGSAVSDGGRSGSNRADGSETGATDASGTGQPVDTTDGGPTCVNPCTAGATQCSAGAVQTCQAQTTGCTAWVTTRTCPATQTCAVSDGKASCSCPASICVQSGTICQDGQTVATCATDSSSCLQVVSTSPCTPPLSCAGNGPSAACSSTCSDTCMPGQASCVNGGLATCARASNGCYAYGTPVACAAHQSCTGAGGSAKCTCNQDPVCGVAGTVCASQSTLATCSADLQGCDFQSSTTPCTQGACTGAAGLAACCTNACTVGATQCAAGAVQTCQVQASGCTAWTTTRTCGTHQTCTVSAGAAACTCSASVCTGTGTVCQDGQTLDTCTVDADKCAFVASTMQCAAPQACSGSAPSASCSLTCSNSCTLGQTSCVNGGLATCALGTNGCRSFGTPTPCGANQSCTGAAGSASCSCKTDPTCGAVAGPTCQSASTLATCSKDSQSCIFSSATAPCTGGACTGTAGHAACCTNACTASATRCGTAGVETCQTQANGCTAWIATTTCGAHQSCAIRNNVATCSCNPSICTGNGAVCQDTQTQATCAMDANACLFVSATRACTAPQVCTGSAPTATCGLTCTNSCTSGQKSCINGGLATCALGTNGCFSFGTPATCPAHQSCTGPAGNANCTCNGDPVCTGTIGPTCATSTTVVTCSKDANGCNLQSTPNQTCTNGACTGAAGAAACCTNACTAGAMRCATGAVQTCRVQSNGCTAWVTTTTCGAHQTCTTAGTSASCMCAASICTSTGSVCQDAQTAATCSLDPNNSCPFVSATSSCAVATPVCHTGTGSCQASSGMCTFARAMDHTACGPALECIGGNCSTIRLTALGPGNTPAAISANGNVVVGTLGAGGAFRWSRDVGIPVQLPNLSGAMGVQANGISGDGNTIVGFAEMSDFSTTVAVRWTGLGAISTLPPPPSGTMSQAVAANSDGTVIVGAAMGTFSTLHERGLIWNLNGTPSSAFIAPPNGGDPTQWGIYPKAVSSDGSSIVGEYVDPTFLTGGFRRTSNGSIALIPLLSGGVSGGGALDISSSATPVVTGDSMSSVGERAFIWTAGSSTSTSIGLAPGASVSTGVAISADGRTVVGNGDFNGVSAPFVWSMGGTPQVVSGILMNAGTDLTGWSLFQVVDASSDCKVLTGVGQHNNFREGWVVILP